MADNRETKKEMFLNILEKKNYNISKTCKAINIERKTYYNWRKDDAVFDADCEALFQADVDDSEERLKLLRMGVPKTGVGGEFIGWKVKPHFGALVTHLKAKAKDRGYGDSIEIKNPHEALKGKTDEEIQALVLENNSKINDLLDDDSLDIKKEESE